MKRQYDAMVESLNLFRKLFGDEQYPELLYHYTSFDGLKGILGSDSLRATFSECLNDASERMYAREVIERHLDTPVIEEPEIPAWAKNPSAKMPPESMFITCFCDDRDNLNMWRSYTQQAGGFALGFQALALANLHPNGRLNVYGPRLVKVHYGDHLTPDMLRALNSEMRSSMRWIFENVIKHPAFKDEKEWRLYLPDPPVEAMSFCGGNATIKPFVSMKHPNGIKLPLRRLVYGPTLRDDQALRTTLTWILKKNGYENVEVVPSEIPYRL
jgi:hypothetical protein